MFPPNPVQVGRMCTYCVNVLIGYTGCNVSRSAHGARVLFPFAGTGGTGCTPDEQCARNLFFVRGHVHRHFLCSQVAQMELGARRGAAGAGRGVAMTVGRLLSAHETRNNGSISAGARSRQGGRMSTRWAGRTR